MHDATRVRRRDAGFSLPELLAVLGIMGTAAAVGMYTVNTGSWRASAAATELARQLELARSRAAFEDHDYRVVFNTTAGTYTVHSDRNSNGTVESALGETQVASPLTRSGSGIVFGFPSGALGIDGATITSAITFTGSPPAVTFKPAGSASNGVIYLVPDEDIGRGITSHMRAISVNVATGRVRRWKYVAGLANPGPWKLER